MGFGYSGSVKSLGQALPRRATAISSLAEPSTLGAEPSFSAGRPEGTYVAAGSYKHPKQYMQPAHEMGSLEGMPARRRQMAADDDAEDPSFGRSRTQAEERRQPLSATPQWENSEFPAGSAGSMLPEQHVVRLRTATASQINPMTMQASLMQHASARAGVIESKVAARPISKPMTSSRRISPVCCLVFLHALCRRHVDRLAYAVCSSSWG